jgi:PAS domain S-box-containing protein
MQDIFKKLNSVGDYKALVNKLLDENTKLKTQYDYIPISTFTFEKINEQIILIQYNKAACKLCNQEKDLLGKNIDEIFIELKEVNKNVKRCFTEKNSFSETTCKKQNNNEKSYFSVNYVFIPENTVMLHIEDITERKKSQDLLKNSEAKFRAIFDNNLTSFAFIDTNGSIQAFNKKAEQNIHLIFNKNLEIGINIYDIFSKKNSQNFIHLFKQSLIGEVVFAEKEIETELGDKIWLELNFSPIFFNNEVSGVFLNILDITKHKTAEQKNREALEKENEFGKLKSNFISIVSHEFRTPLAGIYSNTQLIQKYANRWDKEKKKLVFQRIYNAIQYLNQMLEGVSLLGRDYSGKLSLNIQSYELEPFILQIIEEIHISIGKSARINFTYLCSNTFIKSDKILLRHILSNLLSNAVKYSAQNQIVEFDVHCLEHKILKIKIKDYGIGISSNDLKHIFEPFHRGENAKEIQGTGLGMSIVKRCVSLLNGNISIESEVYKGTIIYLEIPFEI